MASETMKARQMLCAARSQLRSDLRELAEDVLQHGLGVGSEVGQNGEGMRDLDVQRLRTELALRTMASRYLLLSRIDRALELTGETPSVSPGCKDACCAAEHSAASHETAAV